MRALVTGGAGFIGLNLLRELSGNGEVLVFDNLHPQIHGDDGSAAVAEVRRLGGRFVRADVRDRNALEAALVEFKPTVVYHLASETGTGQSHDEPVRYCDVNVQGTTKLVEAIRAKGASVERIVLASSRSIYGEGLCVDPAGNKVTAAPRRIDRMRAGDFGLYDDLGRPLRPIPTSQVARALPASVYASSKMMQEWILQQCFESAGPAVVILRLQNVYGPGQSLLNPYTGVISIFSQQLARGDTLNIYEDGQIVRDFVFVTDVARAFAMAGVLEQTPPHPIDVGSGEATTIERMAQLLLSLNGLPEDKYKITGHFRPGDVRHAVGDIESARDILGWVPQVDFESGLGKFFKWSQSRP